MPAKTIADNAGVEGAVIVGKLLESDETSDYGYNAAKGVPCYRPVARVLQPGLRNRGHRRIEQMGSAEVGCLVACITVAVIVTVTSPHDLA